MSKYTQRKPGNEVSTKEFYGALPLRVEPDSLGDAIRRDSCEDPEAAQARRHFILRLLDPNGENAFDRFVSVFAIDDVEPGRRASFLVSVRQILPDGLLARPESHEIDKTGIIPNADAPDWDAGYFVGVPGLDAGEFYGLDALVLRKPKEEQTQQLRALPLPPI